MGSHRLLDLLKQCSHHFTLAIVTTAQCPSRTLTVFTFRLSASRSSIASVCRRVAGSRHTAHLNCRTLENVHSSDTHDHCLRLKKLPRGTVRGERRQPPTALCLRGSSYEGGENPSWLLHLFVRCKTPLRAGAAVLLVTAKEVLLPCSSCFLLTQDSPLYKLQLNSKPPHTTISTRKYGIPSALPSSNS